MDDHRLLVGIVIEYDDFKKSSGSVGSDHKGSSFAGDKPNRVTDGVRDVVVRDTVLAGAVRDLHETR